MYKERFSLEGKVALITGASRGIGEAIAEGFVEFGASVALASRKLEDLQRVAEKIDKTGKKAVPFPVNIGHVDKLDEVVQAVKEKFGKIDILVNNAATNPAYGPALNLEEWAWDKTFDVNLKGVFFLTQAVARSMIETGGGRIINVASTAGLNPGRNIGLYSITKAGLIMFTRVMAVELAQYNIRVNCIAPGQIETDFSLALRSNKEALENALNSIPLKRIGQSEEVVGAVLYLAGDASSYTSGATIVINGG